MKKSIFLLAGTVIVLLLMYSFKKRSSSTTYSQVYTDRIHDFEQSVTQLQLQIVSSCLTDEVQVNQIKEDISTARIKMKAIDFWCRYLSPVEYKKMNGPLPVEWETEVFEKFEKPYRRDGAGLTLAWQYLQEPVTTKDSLLSLVKAALTAAKVFEADSVTKFMSDYNHFFFCNRLFLLNLSSIYTTGFECPDAAAVITELKAMLQSTSEIYTSYNLSFPEVPLPPAYLDLFNEAKSFAANSSEDVEAFDHFAFIKKYVNPLFAANQQLINLYKARSRSFVDYTLNKSATSIFSKELYRGQNNAGVFLRVEDSAALKQIDGIGKMLFYDPILSGNNMRSCASCHKPKQFFTDTASATAVEFGKQKFLLRNTPSLMNADYNHLIMQDGKHISLQNQGRDVMTNAAEMNGNEATVLQKLNSCRQYKKALRQLLSYTPELQEVTIDHILSAITSYYTSFSKTSSAFDKAVNGGNEISMETKAGFNLFMGKAKCGTCHFVPHFNGVKPPFVSSEFEVIGVPSDTLYTSLSSDEGRYKIHRANETLHAFRTGSLRNITRTAPYMHNGVFKSLMQVIDFYDAGGGKGKGLDIPNQTLSAEKLHLTPKEKKQLLAFLESLNEDIVTDLPPLQLPKSSIARLNKRVAGGTY